MKRWILLLCALLLLGGCTANAEQEQSVEPNPEPVFEAEEIARPDPEPEPEPPPDPRVKTVEALLAEMTLEEKVGQLFFARCPELEAVEKIGEYHLGGYLLFTQDFKDSAGEWLTMAAFMDKVKSFQEASAIPLFTGVDEEGGTVARASRNPNLFPEKFKSPQKVFGAAGNEDFDAGMEAVRADTAEKNAGLWNYGINVNFAPVADVSTDPGDFMYDRAFGQDAGATALYVAAVVSEMNHAGVGSVLKHFPGYGSNVDTHTGIAVDERPYEQFAASDFLPFQAGIDAGAGAVLVSHNIVGCMDPERPASLSPEVHRVLREDLGFEGVVLTDDLSMDAVEAYAEDGSVAVLALLAGNDMVVTGDFEKQIPQVLEAVGTGELTEDAVDEAVRRVLGWKYDLGLLEAGALLEREENTLEEGSQTAN